MARVVAAASMIVILVVAVRLTSRRNGRVRIAYPPMLASLPVVAAQDQQMFQRHHLQAEVVSFGSSNDMVSALVAGQVDVLPAVSLVPLLHLEIQHPGRFRVFSHSRMRRENSTYRIVVKSGSPLQKLQDLQGKRIGVFPGMSATRLIGAFLQRNGVDPKTVAFIQLPPSAQVSSLESGAVDALFSYDPLTLIAEPGKYRPLSDSVYAELMEPCPVGVSVISRDFERRQPDVGARAVGVMQEAIAYVGSHPRQATALLPRFTRMTPEMASRVNVADITLSNQVDAAVLQRFIDMLYEIGEIPEKIDAHRLIDPTR
ncbi:MAG: ABC transporter substrate-binding protein [Acidobacteriia bacterium]|nr:ABC transporter substrate-binding protein [Terriglobia bacterium]